jgi:hypothetical protein
MDVFLVIAPSIVSGLFAIAVCQISGAAARKDNIDIMRRELAVFEAKFDALKEAVDKHNQLVERVFILEGRTDTQEQALQHLDTRVSHLEGH